MTKKSRTSLVAKQRVYSHKELAEFIELCGGDFLSLLCVSLKLHVSGCYGNVQKSHSTLHRKIVILQPPPSFHLPPPLTHHRRRHSPLPSISLVAIHFKCRLPSWSAIRHSPTGEFTFQYWEGLLQQDEIDCLNSWKMRFYFFKRGDFFLFYFISFFFLHSCVWVSELETSRLSGRGQWTRCEPNASQMPSEPEFPSRVKAT